MNWVSTRFAWRSSDWFISSRRYQATNNLTGWRKCLDIKIIWETNTADQRGVISSGQFYCLRDCNDPLVCFYVKCQSLTESRLKRRVWKISVMRYFSLSPPTKWDITRTYWGPGLRWQITPISKITHLQHPHNTIHLSSPRQTTFHSGKNIFFAFQNRGR